MMLLATLAACHAPPTRTTAPASAPASPDSHELPDATYDWHSLLIVPFGSMLKDIPLTLHEVLLFHDVGHGAAAADEAECYAADVPAPRFVERAPDEYLLCFRQDRLARIQASVRLPTAQASDLFDAACVNWLRNVEPATTRASVPGAGACEGREGTVYFSAHLGEEPGRVEASQAETVLSITLDNSAEP